MKVLITILACITIAGCATPPMEVHHVPEFLLILDTSDNLTEMYHAMGGREKAVNGFQKDFVLGVKWSANRDVNGEPIPDLHVLGHEVWHLVKGAWHD